MFNFNKVSTEGRSIQNLIQNKLANADDPNIKNQKIILIMDATLIGQFQSKNNLRYCYLSLPIVLFFILFLKIQAKPNRLESEKKEEYKELVKKIGYLYIYSSIKK